MRTHKHREGNITHWGPSGLVARGGRPLGQISNACGASNIDERLTGAANHHGTCIPMKQTWMFWAYIPELKVKF